MKKLLLLLSILLLTACSQVIEFEPIIIDGFVIIIENELLLTASIFEVSNEIDLNGVTADTGATSFVNEIELDVIPVDVLTGDEVVGLFAELNIEFPEIPEFSSVDVTLSLTNVEFYHYQNDELTFDFEEVTIAVDQTATFNEIIFDNAGVFTFEITDGNVTHTVVVTITEDVDNETLVAVVSQDDLVFVNELTFDLSDLVYETVTSNWIEYNVGLVREQREIIREEERVEIERIEAERIANANIGGGNRPNNPGGNQGGGQSNSSGNCPDGQMWDNGWGGCVGPFERISEGAYFADARGNCPVPWQNFWVGGIDGRTTCVREDMVNTPSGCTAWLTGWRVVNGVCSDPSYACSVLDGGAWVDGGCREFDSSGANCENRLSGWRIWTSTISGGGGTFTNELCVLH